LCPSCAALFYGVEAAEAADHDLRLTADELLIDLHADGFGPIVVTTAAHWLLFVSVGRPPRWRKGVEGLAVQRRPVDLALANARDLFGLAVALPVGATDGTELRRFHAIDDNWRCKSGSRVELVV
jgi:hypothetical protein